MSLEIIILVVMLVVTAGLVVAVSFLDKRIKDLTDVVDVKLISGDHKE